MSTMSRAKPVIHNVPLYNQQVVLGGSVWYSSVQWHASDMTLIYLPDSRLVTQSRRRRITVITAAAPRETHITAVLCSVVRNITSLSYSCYISRRAAFTLYAFFHVCVKSWANKSFLCKPFLYLGLRCLDASTFYPTTSNILWLFSEKVKALILIIDDLGVFVVYLQTFGRLFWLCIAAVAPFYTEFELFLYCSFLIM